MTSSQERTFGKDFCLFGWKDKGTAKEISQVASSINTFVSLLIFTAAHFRMLWMLKN